MKRDDCIEVVEAIMPYLAVMGLVYIAGLF